MITVSDQRRDRTPVRRREPQQRQRRRREDAGLRRMQPRDAAALQWLGEQYGAQYDVLSVLLARLAGKDRISVHAAREVALRWEAAGWAKRWRLPGGIWVVPTKAALQLTGRSQVHFPAPPEWTPQVARLPHTRAVAIVRLSYERQGSPGGEWISDRLLWQERRIKEQRMSARFPDAELRPEQGQRTAIEVELTIKSSLRYGQILSSYPAHISRLLWLTPSELVERLKGVLGRTLQENEFRGEPLSIDVQPLPQVGGLPYEMWEVKR